MRIFSRLGQYRRYLVVLFLLLAAFLVFAVSLRGIYQGTIIDRAIFSLLSPLQRTVSSAGRTFLSLRDDYLDLVSVRQENDRFRERLKEMTLQESVAREAIRENERLTRLLEMKKRLSPPTITASVIGEDGYPWFRTIMIDRGSSSGVTDGAAVIAASGIVGQVVRVSPESARVLLFTDPASSVAGVIQRTRARGVVKGKGGGRASVEFTLREDDVTVGDLVVTSGVGGIFPKGLPIGEVTVVRKGEYGIFQNIEIHPSVNLARLEEVLVCVGKSP
ncbi:MAG: rod shape-determining protein MreC [Desulfuromonadia bacterium]